MISMIYQSKGYSKSVLGGAISGNGGGFPAAPPASMSSEQREDWIRKVKKNNNSN